MNRTEHELELTRRYLEGVASLEETQELESLIVKDASVRQDFLRYTHLDSALAGVRRSQPSVVVPRRSVWLSWRPLAAAAAGIVLGIFCTSVVFGYVVPHPVAKEKRFFPLRNGDFEQSGGVLPTNPPASFNIWSGDGAEVVAGFGEASPKSGRRMLRFTRAETAPHTAQGFPAWCDAYQLIDLRQVWDQVAADDEVTLEVRASFFDHDPGPHGSGNFRCRLLINPKSPDIVRAGWPDSRSDGCAYARTDLENGPATRGQWRTAQAKVILPRSARVAAIHLGVIRFTDAQQPGAEFGHCYVDDVSLTVTARSLRQKE